MLFICFLYVLFIYFLIILVFAGIKYFGILKYFFRLSYTSGVQSVPVCAVQWIHFNVLKDSINCSIGQIAMQSWHELIPHQILKNKPFISFLDLLPSRFALSYIPNHNRRSSWMEVAFIALDSEKLGEHVDDAYYLDFGDNIFPHFKGNRKTKSVFEEEDDSDEEIDDDCKKLSYLNEFIPRSIIEFLVE